MKENHKLDIGTWKKDLRLYVHVPFCVKKCAYCDFLSGPSDEKGIKSYFEALYKEIMSYKNRTKEYTVSSIFIGGGTPSCVPSDYITSTLDEIYNIFSLTTEIEPEITIEINPGTMDAINSSGHSKNKLIEYKKAGINRLSFGLQSTHDHELRLLGRIHSYSQFVENYKLARAIGFNNINIDLMSALPDQSVSSWEETLYRIAELKPEHISAYSLIIEEGTPFYYTFGPEGKDKDRLPSDETDRLIYTRTKEILSSFGYNRYEISNYAKEGYECRQNRAYWEGVSYLGLGLGSASLIDNTRFNNTHLLGQYIELISKHNKIMYSEIHEESRKGLLYDYYDIRREIASLTKNQQIEEFMFLGLRETRGISKSKFLDCFGIHMEDIYSKQLDKLLKEGLLIIDNDIVRLTDYGIDISNRVLAEFLLE